MGRRAAERPERPGIDPQVEIASHLAERIVARQTEFRTRLPSAILAGDDARIEATIEARPCPDAALRRLDRDPVPGGDAGRVPLRILCIPRRQRTLIPPGAATADQSSRRPWWNAFVYAATACNAGSIRCFRSNSRYGPGRAASSVGEPSSTILPRSITMIRSKLCNVDSR